MWEGWMAAEIVKLEVKYGTVPPPWVVYNEHPYSICWRMGSGEPHIMLWWEWWSRQNFIEDRKLEYFRQYPPPHCWLLFLIEALWDVDVITEEDNLSPYFSRTSELEFGNEEDYEKDLEDPKWLEERH